MLTRRIGRSGLEVSRLALGTMSWGSDVDEFVAADLLGAFLEAGGTLIDTAPIYGDGRAESVLGDALSKAGVREEVVIAGKCGLAHRGEQVVRDASRRTVLAQLDRTLRDLGTDHLDIWQVHRWDEGTPIDETLSALEFALRTGRTRYVGVSNFTGWQTSVAASVLGPGLISTQMEYSLLNRSVEAEVLPAADHHGMGLIAWAPLGRGVLTGKYRDGVPGDSRGAHPRWERYVAPYLDRVGVVEALLRAADGLEVPPTHVALAWLRDRPGVASAIVGARTAEQLAESLASEESEVPREILTALDDISEI